MSRTHFFLTNQLNEVETQVVTCIIRHLDNGERKVSIAQIANECYVSTAFISKMCKRLGFAGYTELVYNLSQSQEEAQRQMVFDLSALVDNYSEEQMAQFLRILREYQDTKCFVVGEGFADTVADYIAQRLSVCGFMAFNRVQFYDYMVFRESHRKYLQNNIEPSFIIAISQSGETESVLGNIRRAKQNGFRVIAFTKMAKSSLAEEADLTFVVDSARQALISAVPNPFFGKVIIAMEELLGLFFQQEQNRMEKVK